MRAAERELMYAQMALSSALPHLRAVPDDDALFDQADRIYVEVQELERDLRQLSGWRETPA